MHSCTVLPLNLPLQNIDPGAAIVCIINFLQTDKQLSQSQAFNIQIPPTGYAGLI